MKRAATLVLELSCLIITMLNTSVERLWWAEAHSPHVAHIRHLELEQFSSEVTYSPVVIFTDRQD